MFSKIMNFVLGCALGVLAGGVCASLLTPKSGEEVRNDIKKGFDEIKLEYESGKEKKREDLESEIRKRWGEE